MGSSPNAITQAGNLYMFVMHNPVRWNDPTGLFAVLAEYIALKNGGFMWSITCSSGVNNSVTIQIGDIVRTFSGSDISFSHGRFTIDHSILMSEFGLSFEQATHRPWDWFSSMECAAIAFSLMHTDLATEINREIGAMIYSVRTGSIRNPDVHYTFGAAWTGGENDVILGLLLRSGGGLVGERGRPFRSCIAALAHTHPVGARNFSQEDRNIAHGVYHFGMDFVFIGVPAMPVFMSVNLSAEQGGGMEVRVFDSSMDRTAHAQRGGRLIFSR